MIDGRRLLDSLLGAGPGGSTQAGPGGQASGFGGIGDIARGIGSPEGVRDGAGRVMEMARQNPLAAGAILAAVLGTGAGRGLAGSAIKLGGLAAIASMAYQAYQRHQGGAPAAAAPGASAAPELTAPPSDTAFHPANAPQGEAEFALSLVRAMIAAAKADGRIDEAERQRIADRVRLAGLDAEAEGFLVEEFAKPVDIDALVASAATDAQRVELYTAARLAIEPDSRTERGFLDLLAAAKA